MNLGDNVPPFHLNNILVNPPAVDDATSLWYEMVMMRPGLHCSPDITCNYHKISEQGLQLL